MTTQIDLSPKAGFCIKSTTTAAGAIELLNSVTPPLPNTLEPRRPTVLPVPVGLKVFLNIAWDAQVPPPPQGSEDAIQKAMQGEGVDEKNSEGWYVPVIVSNPRQDKDKAGNPSLVFDCIYNASLKSRTLRDPDFKIFLVELGLQRIEAQTGLVLSRSIGTPNIASKGKLLPRTVQIPSAMLEGTRSKTFDKDPTTGPASGGPLIEEVFAPSPSANPSVVNQPIERRSDKKVTAKKDDTLPGLRGVLKKSSTKAVLELTKSQTAVRRDLPLEWSWAKGESGRICVEFDVPGLTIATAQNSTLDVETRRIVLSVPNRPVVDIDVSASDAQIASQVGVRRAANNVQDEGGQEAENQARQEETTRTLMLKRQRDFDVEGASAEWKVGTEKVIVWL